MHLAIVGTAAVLIAIRLSRTRITYFAIAARAVATTDAAAGVVRAIDGAAQR